MAHMQSIPTAPPRRAAAALRPAIILDDWQYRLSADPHPGAERIGDYWLTVGHGIHCVNVINDTGQDCGVLLGFPVDLDRSNLITRTWRTPVTGGVQTDAEIHRTLRALGGRYIWIARHPSGTRIYPDAAAQVTCVWDAAGKEAGATAGAILQPSDYKRRFRAKLFDQLRIIGEGWFPAGLTAHDGIERLLPNHYLDLRSWTAHRFEAVRPSEPPPTAVIDTMRHSIRAHVHALRKGPLQPAIALTAGRESRAILACLRDQAPDLTFVTVTGADRHQTDTIMARKIATAFGLRHETLPRKTADPAAQNRFLKRSGHCFGDSSMRYHPSTAPLTGKRVFVSGIGGEVARGFYWSGADSADMTITPALLMQRFGLPTSRIVEAAIMRWLDGLPTDIDAQGVLDLAYLELRLGPWAMAQYCADPTVPRVAPMLTYNTIRMMRDLPISWRAAEKLNQSIITQHWPALDTFPYNTLGPWQDSVVKIQRLKDNPLILLKKLRQSRFVAGRNNFLRQN